MLGRLLAGLILGALSGGVVAWGVTAGLGVTSFVATAAIIAYLAAAATGVLTGLVAGRPIWAKGALIESVLKGVFGAAVAAFGLFALRTWLPGLALPIPWNDPAVHGPIASLPFLSLPLVGALLGAFYGVDNTAAPPAPAGKRVATSAPEAARIAELADDSAEEKPERRARR